MTKIRLNDEQWRTLEVLLEANTRRAATNQIRVPDRLTSNGLVAADRQGGQFLTPRAGEAEPGSLKHEHGGHGATLLRPRFRPHR